MNPRTAPERILVIGSGITALCAALAFARALPRARVTLVATPLRPDALADRLPALDTRALALLARFGVDERVLLAAAAATHRVGQRFAWGGAPFTVEEGDGLPLLAGASLHQLWRAHGDGPLHALVPGAALAAAERFVHPDEEIGALRARFDYALRLDPGEAPALLAAVAHAAGVHMVSAGRAVPAPDGGATIDGEHVTADLVVDAAGPRESDDWIDWRETLPADRLLLAAGPPAPSPTDHYQAVADGWTARWPLARRTLTGFAYAGAITDDARARRAFGTGAEGVAIRPGRRATPLTGRLLALGDAAAAPGPLGWHGLPLALAQLELALDLMPARNDAPDIAAEYNRRAGTMAERVHAYAAAFYLAGEARKGAFWHALRDRAAPPELATARAQFGRRGTLPPIEDAMIARGSWQQALTGLGIRPEIADPLAVSVPRTSAVAALTQLRQAVAALAGALPPYPDMLAAMRRDERR
ncbi:tryptophan halogenase [Sphingomonas metalli]|uniref:Tryptophan halogenase n=1 Tax=Sphingomonas metalli TaxID=1779358 RepID=A0A916TCF1_9SPHN|nr:tryptophan 7-halogenase [Sphingomonas metalli]GGB39995.1 tryptophan halogenase [Sphingomonas metalli]